MEVFPCPLGILALRLCRSVAASKSFGHRGGDFSQLADERINLFAPFAVSAETEPDDRWKRPQISFERSNRTCDIFPAQNSTEKAANKNSAFALPSFLDLRCFFRE